MKNDIKKIQAAVGVTADGIIGAQTLAALKQKLGIEEAYSWAKKSDILAGKSVFGTAGAVPMTKIVPPYQFYYEGEPIASISVHSLIAEAVKKALGLVLAHYGLSRIQELKLDQYDGCFCDRNATGGSVKSMHAWAIALDFCAAQNGYKTRAPEALFSGDSYSAWWDIWESVGARSFGRENGYDWMHVEFCTV